MSSACQLPRASEPRRPSAEDHGWSGRASEHSSLPDRGRWPADLEKADAWRSRIETLRAAEAIYRDQGPRRALQIAELVGDQRMPGEHILLGEIDHHIAHRHPSQGPRCIRSSSRNRTPLPP